MTEKTPPNVRIFAVKTRFQELAQRPGGIPREIAIQQAESGIEGYKAEFVDWVERELQELTQALRKIDSAQPDMAQLDEIYARSRQLRDTGTTMGLALLTFVALDKDGKKLPVPPLLMESADEKIAAEEAAQRRTTRLALKAKPADTWLKLLEKR